MQDFVDFWKQSAVQGMEMFLRNFSHVPDEKLFWTLTPSAKSPIRIAAHTALYGGLFARMMLEQKLPPSENLAEWLERRNAAELAVVSRTEMETIFRKGTDEVLSALDQLTPEAVESSLDSGSGGSISMKHLMTLPGWHATLHCGQIDYLQTCWGDQEIYVE